MTHHTFKHRLKMAFLKNRNWKKILVHEAVEYGLLIPLVAFIGLEGFLVGIAIAFFIHIFFFETIDKFHKRLDTIIEHGNKGSRKA